MWERETGMEFLFEIIFEIILEGSLAVGSNKKICMPLRILALLIFLLIFGGVIFIIGFVGFELFQENTALGIMVFVLDAFLIGGVVWKFVKKLKNPEIDFFEP